MTTNDAQMRAEFRKWHKERFGWVLEEDKYLVEDGLQAQRWGVWLEATRRAGAREAALREELSRAWAERDRLATLHTNCLAVLAAAAPEEKPKTRRDINVAKLSPGVRALHDALLSHDSAAMTLFVRDDQVAWVAKEARGNERPVTVGQLREVLVAALGLPAGTKFGG